MKNKHLLLIGLVALSLIVLTSVALASSGSSKPATTLAEMARIKAWLLATRHTVRDYLDTIVLLERLGEAPLAVSNIIYSCFAVFCVPLEGFAEATCSMVSRLVGRRRPRSIAPLMREMMSPAYLVTLPLLVFAMLFPRLLLSLFTSDPAVIGAGVWSLRVVALAMLVVVPADLWAAAVSGTGDTGAAFAIEAVLSTAMVACGYLAAFVIGRGQEYVWMSLPVAWTACLVLSFLWIRGGRWKRVEL